MRCRGFELVLLLGMAIAAHAAESQNSAFFRNVDLTTIQIVHLDSNGLARATPYRLILSIAPILSADTAPFGAGFGSACQLPAGIEKQKEIAWAANANGTKVFGRDRTPLLPLLRIESKGERLEFKPRRHSLSIEWRKAFP